MMSVRSCIAVVLMAGVLTACGSGSTDESLLLAYVPADTPYVYAHVERTPADANDAWLQLVAPVGDGLRASAARARTALMTAADDRHRVAIALLQLLEERLNVDGWRRMGMRIDPLIAFYGIGAIPVLRVELGDPEAFRAFVDEAGQRAKTQLPVDEVDGHAYWRFELGEDGDAAVIMSIQDQSLVLTIDIGKRGPALADLLGLRRPARSILDSGELQEINRDLDFTPYGTLLVDGRRLLATLIDDAGLVSRRLAEDGESLTPECRTELTALAEVMPRWIAGYQRLDTRATVTDNVLELRPDLARGLMSLPAPVPGLGRVDETVLIDIGFGIKLDKLAEFIQAQAGAIRRDPYTCEWLTGLNRSADGIGQQVAGMYMAASWFTGLRLALTQVQWDGEYPTQVEAAVVLASPSPSALIGMIRGFVPQLAQLELAVGAPPQPIELGEFAAELMPEEPPPAFAALADGVIGIAIGADADRELAGYLASAPADPPPLIYMGFDGVTYSLLARKLDDLVVGMEPGSEPALYDMAQDSESEADEAVPLPSFPSGIDWDHVLKPLGDSVDQMYKGLGYSWMTLAATERGLELRQEARYR